jgi:PhzF family phenazine biosynthesis protein
MGKNVVINLQVTALYKVNSFVAEGCLGNPAGVCLLKDEPGEDFRVKTAVKVCAAETAFVIKNGNGFDLRWFTAGGVEVALCGHATLAAAYILWHKGHVKPENNIEFYTKSGTLIARREGDLIVLDFPKETIKPVENSKIDFNNLIGTSPVFIGKTSFDYFLVVDSEAAVKNLAPDFRFLKKIPGRGIIITAKSSHPEYDFISRFFAPAVGVDEDPVTGSAHCALGPYWSKFLKKKALVGYQASKEGGMVRVEVLPDRVLLKGKAGLVDDTGLSEVK